MRVKFDEPLTITGPYGDMEAKFQPCQYDDAPNNLLIMAHGFRGSMEGGGRAAYLSQMASMFVNVLRRVSVFADAALGLAKLQLKNGELLVSTENKDYSISAEEKVACNYTGDDLTIGFKASFLIEILNNIPSTEVLVELSDPTRAGIIVPLENKENEDLLMLLMPMMLSDF